MATTEYAVAFSRPDGGGGVEDVLVPAIDINNAHELVAAYEYDRLSQNVRILTRDVTDWTDYVEVI